MRCITSANLVAPFGFADGISRTVYKQITLPSGTFLILGIILHFLKLAELDLSIMFTKVLNTPTQTEA